MDIVIVKMKCKNWKNFSPETHEFGGQKPDAEQNSQRREREGEGCVLINGGRQMIGKVRGDSRRRCRPTTRFGGGGENNEGLTNGRIV